MPPLRSIHVGRAVCHPSRPSATASPRTFERFTGRLGGYVGGIPKQKGWHHYVRATKKKSYQKYFGESRVGVFFLSFCRPLQRKMPPAAFFSLVFLFHLQLLSISLTLYSHYTIPSADVFFFLCVSHVHHTATTHRCNWPSPGPSFRVRSR